MDQKLSKVDTFMELARVWAKRSTCSSRIAVGAVLVNQHNQVIASGYNGAPRRLQHCNDVGCTLDTEGHCINVIHGEENVILQCAINGVSSNGGVLYVTHSPCFRCCQRIIQAGITAVIYGIPYGDFSASYSILKLAEVPMTQYKSEQEWLDD